MVTSFLFQIVLLFSLSVIDKKKSHIATSGGGINYDAGKNNKKKKISVFTEILISIKYLLLCIINQYFMINTKNWKIIFF